MLRTVAVFGIFGSFALVAASAVGVLGSAGCSSKSSSSGGGGGGNQVECTSSGCTACTGPAADAGSPVSFATDIQPILQNSCGVGGGTCHGAYPASASAQSLYLAEAKGADDGYGDAGAVVEGILGMSSLEVPTMDIVKAGDPSNSYLMHKLNGDMCAIMSECAPTSTAFPNSISVPCGTQMPQASANVAGQPLSTADTTLFWNWIAQGAHNN
jgi:hypothetical protein